MAIEKKSRLDQVVLAFGDDGALRGAHASNFVQIVEDGVVLTDKHETASVPFDTLATLIPIAPQLARVGELEAKLAAEVSEKDALALDLQNARAEIERLRPVETIN